MTNIGKMKINRRLATREAEGEKSDVVFLLFRDVCKLPIITSHRQDMWLGIQIKAASWIERICQEAGLDPAAPDISLVLTLTAYRSVIDGYSELENDCLKIHDIQAPKLEALAAELLSVRQDIFALRRSRFRRFIQTLAKIAEESVRSELTDCACDAAELLCILPDSALDHIVEFEQTFERLPSADELAEWLETAAIPINRLRTIHRQAKAARDILVTGYLRYALRIARKYVENELDYADLVQEAIVGLMKAAERYNYREHSRFVHYATSWIWQNIGRAVADQGRTIRLPVHMHEQIRKVEEVYQTLSDSGQYNPTPDDILVQMDLLSEEDKEILGRLRDKGTLSSKPIPRRCEKALKRVQRLMTYAQPTIPLDFALPDRITRNTPVLVRDYLSAEVDLSDLIPDWDNPTPNTIMDLAIIRQTMEQAFEGLTSREQDVITLRFGFYDGQDRTLEEIGQEFNVTRERIRQIEKRAIEKLKRTLSKRLAVDDLVPVEGPLVHLPFEVVIHLDKEFNHWQHPKIENGGQDWRWLDQLIEQLPGGDWRRGRLGDRMTRKDQLRAALRSCAAPAHYANITEQLNDTLERDELEERYVYTLLMKHEQTFILLGQGVFSLLEWERDRAAQTEPVLPLCPSLLPDPSDQNDAFFESVLVARDILKNQPATDQFLKEVFNWAGARETQPKWFQQSVLSAYYLLGLIPYTFCFDGRNPRLECTLPEMGLHELRRYCLHKLTERLVAMPEFWWTFQRYQPARRSALGVQFAEIHPLGLDDAINRLSILTSLGASQRLSYGQYRLTLLGEELADQWKRRPTFAHDAETLQEPRTEDDLEPIDLAIW